MVGDIDPDTFNHEAFMTAAENVIEVYVHQIEDWNEFESRVEQLRMLWPQLHEALEKLVNVRGGPADAAS